MRRAPSSSCSCFKAALTDILCGFEVLGERLENMLCSWLVISSMPGGAIISTPALGACNVSSISLSSNSPSRSFLRSNCRVDESLVLASPSVLAGGNKTSNIRSSAASSARGFASLMSRSRSILNADSVRSRIIDSTSRPTYPTSVNLVASTLMKGASAKRASLLAISVLPTPVGPIMRIFLGEISCISSGDSCCRRHRLRRAIATARFALS